MYKRFYVGRYVYNRVVLENAAVRAAAVSSLAKFGAHSEELLPNILVLLRRCLLDTDDEVYMVITFSQFSNIYD